MITVGSVLNDRYQLDSLVGQGGFATVYRATDRLLRRRVAVKVLKPEVVAEDPRALNAFDEEARRVADLDHPNILPVYDYGRVEDTAFLVMPFVEGGTLNDLLRRTGTLSLNETGDYLRQVAAALDFAHARGVVHRDIKPQNILLRDDGRHLLVADFGIAKVLSATSSKTVSRGAGTIAYMPPEQFRGETSRAGDVYALGCVLFQLLAGDVPYTGAVEAVMFGHIAGDIPSLANRASAPALASLQPVIDRALAKGRAERFPTAGDLARAYATVTATPMPTPTPTMPSEPTGGDQTIDLTGSPSRAPLDETRPRETTIVPAPAPTVVSPAVPADDRTTVPLIAEPSPALTTRPLPTIVAASGDSPFGDRTVVATNSSAPPPGNGVSRRALLVGGLGGLALLLGGGAAVAALNRGAATPTPAGDLVATSVAATVSARGTEQAATIAAAPPTATTASVAAAITPSPTVVPPTPTAVPPTLTPIPPTATAVPPTPTAVPPTPTPKPEPGAILYQADWSNGATGWSGSAEWKTVGGMLVNDGTGGFSSVIIAPYQPGEIANYAVEAEIQGGRGDGNCVNEIGVILRAVRQNNAWQGYRAGLDGGFTSGSGCINDAFISVDGRTIDRQRYDSNKTGWHQCRVEVQNNVIRLMIDGRPVVEGSDNRYLAAGRVGLFSTYASFNIRTFKVIVL